MESAMYKSLKWHFENGILSRKHNDILSAI